MNNSTSLYEKLMKEAINERNKLSTDTIIRIRKLYEEVADDLLKKADTAKGGFTRAWTSDYEKYMRSKIIELDSALVNLTSDSIISSTQIAASVNGDFINFINDKYKLDIDKELINIAYSVNNDVIAKILQGGLYKDNKSVSERIWGYSKNTMSDIQHIITKGMIEQKSYLEMIKDLEKYVDPKAKKPWNFGTVYPNLKNKQVDFNAQRLLRTSINHSFFACNLSKANENPYIEAVHWNLSSQHYVRQVKHRGEDECDEYTRQDNYKLGTGNFPKDNVPLPHCQCMCYQTMVIPKSLDDIGNELGLWVRGIENPQLDSMFRSNDEKANNINTSTQGQKATEFIKAKTVEEALDFAKKITGNKDFKYGDFSLQNINVLNEALFDCYKKINKPLINIKEVANMPREWARSMQASYSKEKSRIYMKGGKSNTYLSTLEKSAIRDFSTGFSASEHKLSTLHHEIGHSVYEDLSYNTKEKINEIFEEVRHKAYLEWIEAGGSSSGLTQADLHKKVLSKYAFKDNDPNEFFAEAFSQIVCNKMRPVARKVYSIIKSDYMNI